MIRFAALVFVLACTAAVAGAQVSKDEHARSPLQIPSSLVAEHRELHEQLAAAIKSGGKTAVAAEEVEAKLMPHFRREEEFAMPPLALLEPLAQRRGLGAADRRTALRLTQTLRREYPRMLREHRQIVGALKHLAEVAAQEHKPEVASFAEKLKAHAANEEQILYPAALLIGDRLSRQTVFRPKRRLG